jgi:hypothetical protein
MASDVWSGSGHELAELWMARSSLTTRGRRKLDAKLVEGVVAFETGVGG